MSPRPRVIVTGAASGLGLACVSGLQAAGCAVSAIDRRDAQAATEHAAVCDVADPEALAATVTEAVGVLGGLDGAVHCAGVFPDQVAPLHAVAPSTWNASLAVNLTGAYALARAVLPELIRSRGSLVLAASVHADQPQPGAAVYAAAKAGVRALARAAALEYAHHGVRVNTVSPGWMDTAMAAPALARPARRERVETSIPAGRVATPVEVADAVLWLLSDRAAYVTGQDIVVDGGMSASASVLEGDVGAIWRRMGG